MERISSRRNPVVRQFRDAAALGEDRLLLDGLHLVDEALGSGLEVELVAVADCLAEGTRRELVRRAGQAGARILSVSDTVLEAISPVHRPSGVVAVARRRSAALATALATPPQLVLMLHDVQDPGNVGAIIRVAEACGATGIVTGEGTAAPFGWKALRGSMGSAFRLPVATRQPLDAALDAARARGLRVHAAVPAGGTVLPQCDLRGPTAVLLGSEGGGLPGALVAAADEQLTIPMRAPVDSLNVATAAALVVYEAHRQRTAHTP